MITLGPIHPTLDGLFKLDIETKNDIATQVHVTTGYQHRSFENHAKHLEYRQIIPYIDRLDYLSACNNELPFVLACEQLMGLKIPKRAQDIRIILCELNRIASHLYFLYIIGKNLFFPIITSKSLQIREIVLDLLEMITGARLLYNFFCIGGVSMDLTIGMEEEIKTSLPTIQEKISEFDHLLLSNPLVVQRTARHGLISKKMAETCNLTGPNLRASAALQGDMWSRINIRVQEIKQSLQIIQHVLEKISQGPYNIHLDHIIPPKGEVCVKTENPRGEMGFRLTSNGTEKPSELSAKTPSSEVVAALPKICTGVDISDIPLFLASLDISISEVDL